MIIQEHYKTAMKVVGFFLATMIVVVSVLSTMFILLLFLLGWFDYHMMFLGIIVGIFFTAIGTFSLNYCKQVCSQIFKSPETKE